MKAYVINLPERTDRWEMAVQELCPHFEVTKVVAEKSDCGWKGNATTLRRLFSVVNGPALVFEDDATFDGTVNDLQLAINDLPENFDMLLLGANVEHNKIEKISDRVVRTYGSWCTHAVYYSEKFIRQMRSRVADQVIDEHYRTVIHPQGNSYVVYPFLSVQRKSFSDLKGDVKDYTRWFVESQNKIKEALQE